MASEATIGLGALALVVGFPLVLLGGLGFLGWLEAWMVQPDERAAAVRSLLEEKEDSELEAAVAALLAQVADVPGQAYSVPPVPASPAERRSVRPGARSMLAG